MREVRFYVAGNPVPQGSARAFVVKGRAVVTSTSGNKLKDWRQAIGTEARAQAGELASGPVAVELDFVLQRPKSTSKSVHWIHKRPDIDKLVRAALDAMSGVVFGDDAQVAQLRASKRYTVADEQPGVLVAVRYEDE